MNLVEEAIAKLGIPGSIAVVILIIFAVLQLIGEFIEAFGKVAPPFLKLRKVIIQHLNWRKERDKTLCDVRSLLSDVNSHYNADNIAKRNEWMQWVNSRASVYDETILQYKIAIERLTEALDKNTKMTEQMFIESSRDRIIDFASKVTCRDCLVSREEFNRIFKVYQKYENFLKERNLKNGEVEMNYQFIKDAYKDRTEKHNFTEDLKK